MAWTPFNFFKYDPDKIDFSKTTFNIKQALNNNWEHIQALIEELRTRADNTSIIVKNNVSLKTSAWSPDTTYEDYPYRASVSIDGCTAKHIPEVTFSLVDSTSGNLAPIAETYDGGVYIYASERPADMTIPTIKLVKVVE